VVGFEIAYSADDDDDDEEVEAKDGDRGGTSSVPTSTITEV